jgi:hypothetical protein
MTLRDGLALTAILGGLALIFFVSWQARDERVEPGSPEHAAYIDGLVAQCLDKQWTQTVQHSDGSRDPRSQTNREASCREFVLQADRFNPSGRPLKRR